MAEASDPCVFCDIVGREESGRLVLATEQSLAFLPDVPAVPHHTLVIPRTHVRDVWELNGDGAANLARDVQRVAEIVRDAVSPDGLNIIQSNGVAAGQSVFHLHVHVVPRFEGDRIPELWPEDYRWNPEDLDAMAAELRSAAAS